MAQRVLSDATNSGARYRSTASSGKAAGGAPTVTFAAAAEARYPESLLPTRSSRRFSLSDFTIPRKGGHIGSGRFGQVLRVTENSSKRALVLKRVSKQALVDEGAVRQFQREVEIHCRVRHPNIIRMFAYFHDAESCYILLELAELGNLYNRIEAGRLAEREAALLFRQIASAVAHLHARGVIHRDIKPENVFLARESSAPDAPAVVKLGDLGWAIVKRATSRRTTICGTMEYLPPEVCRGAAAAIAAEGGNRGLVAGASIADEYDESFDLYTLGVLLYEMLVGHSPFVGPSWPALAGGGSGQEAAIMARITAGTFQIPHSLPRDVHMLIRQLMSAEPASRPSAAEILAHAWVVRHAGHTQDSEWA